MKIHFMNNTSKLKYLCLSIVMALFFACSDDTVKDNPDVVPDQEEPAPEVPEYPKEPEVNEQVEMVAQIVAGFVRDSDGNPIENVTVTTGSRTVNTNSDGLFSFTEIGAVSNRGVFRFTKDGYFDVVRSFDKARERFDVVLYPKGNGEITASESFSSDSGKRVDVGDMKVDIPSSALVDESGNEYSGTVSIDMIYMDPNNEHFADMMPGGDLKAVRFDNSSTQLLSYGMVGVNLTGSDGSKLQLKDGKRSTVTFPIPEGMDENPPATIPLWHFNENAGLWVESGEAELNGNEYVGTVGHFSYVNLDTPGGSGRVEVYVYLEDADSDGDGDYDEDDLLPLLGAKVHIGQNAEYTNIKGFCSASVPAGVPMNVWVDSKGFPVNNVSDLVKTVTVESDQVVQVVFCIKNEGGYPGIPVVSAKVRNNDGFISVAARLDYNLSGTPVSYSMISYTGYVALLYQGGCTGPATFSLTELGTGKLLYSHEINLTGLNIDLGTIDISSDTGIGGVFDIEYTDSNGKQNTASINIPEINSTSGIIVVDDDFYGYSFDDDSEDAFDMILSGYSFHKTDYNNVFAFVSEGNVGFDSENLNASIVEEDNELFRINLSGYGTFADGNAMIYDENARLASAKIVMPLLMAAKRNMNVSSLESLDLPDFTPSLLSVPDIAVIVERGYICDDGGILYYKNVSFDDYLALIDNIKKEGKLDSYFEDNESESYAESIFITDDKMITVSYESEGLSDIFVEDYSCVMSVMIMDGINNDGDGFLSRKSEKSNIPVLSLVNSIGKKKTIKNLLKGN